MWFHHSKSEESMFDKEPDAINEEGTKWWIDHSSNHYAHKPDSFGTTLEEIECFYIETKDGFRTRLIVCNDNVIYDNQALDAIGYQIDFYKLLKRDAKGVFPPPEQKKKKKAKKDPFKRVIRREAASR
jgi:hypothetical protein